MAQYSVAATKDKLSSLIDTALDGEDIVITNRGKPAAKIVPADRTASANIRSATDRLRARVLGKGEASGMDTIPVRRFSDWLYEGDAP